MKTYLIAAGLLGAICAGGGGAAWAQSNPSADQIINSLRPGAGMVGGTRGIRPVAPAAPSEAAPAAASAPMAPRPAPRPMAPASNTAPAVASAPVVTSAPPAGAASSAPSVNLTVQFANNSAELTPAATRTLSELGRALSSSSLATYRFRIEGHTDTVGSPEANKALSDRRAKAVVAFLSSSFKIDPARLEAVGMGEDGLMVQTPANTAEARNRRVQVINLGG